MPCTLAYQDHHHPPFHLNVPIYGAMYNPTPFHLYCWSGHDVSAFRHEQHCTVRFHTDNHSMQADFVMLRCIKDWISTVLLLTWVACNISEKKNAMGIWCDIPSHPTRSRPLPHPKPCPQIFNTFVPAKCTKLLICRSNCLHFFSWIQVSIIALNRFLGRRMIVCARVSQKRRKLSP